MAFHFVAFFLMAHGVASFVRDIALLACDHLLFICAVISCIVSFQTGESFEFCTLPSCTPWRTFFAFVAAARWQGSIGDFSLVESIAAVFFVANWAQDYQSVV